MAPERRPSEKPAEASVQAYCLPRQARQRERFQRPGSKTTAAFASTILPTEAHWLGTRNMDRGRRAICAADHTRDEIRDGVRGRTTMSAIGT